MRAAINTPIQGSAADVATAAMLSIAACPELRALGWTMLLQVRVPSRVHVAGRMWAVSMLVCLACILLGFCAGKHACGQACWFATWALAREIPSCSCDARSRP